MDVVDELTGFPVQLPTTNKEKVVTETINQEVLSDVKYLPTFEFIKSIEYQHTI
jgi:hypothetical protein